MDHQYATLWPPFLAALQIALAAAASAHAVLHKRDVRAAIGWVGLVWLVPFGGAVLYLLFGINRIRRRASGLRAQRPHPRLPTTAATGAAPPAPGPPGDNVPDAASWPPAGATEQAESPGLELRERALHLISVARLVDRITGVPVTFGNSVEPLTRGAVAYESMLHAIDQARRTVGLLTYIFDQDKIGRRFADALDRAVRRGVEVRVLIDGVGARYSRPPIMGLLARRNVPVAAFLPSVLPLSLYYANLRNHRKILVADGEVGFTGGMNIRDGHAEDSGPGAIRDLHFRLEGPVVAHLTDTFADDWAFAAGERLSGAGWFPPPQAAGPVLARGIAAGPDEAFERVRWAILAALSQAAHRIRIVTPYFLPDTALSTALQLASLRGVKVDIVLPERGNLRLVQWASWAKLLPFVTRGCRLWLNPPPFDHSKLMTVDDVWSLIGSTNWDPRSLRLNFEFNVECYDAQLADVLDGVIDALLARARPLTEDALRRRLLVLRLRDGAAWLLSPYL